MSRRIGLLGVPTSAGSHNAGQDRAPAAWRAAGLVAALSGSGLAVVDYGDLPVTVHRPSPRMGGVRDVGRVASVAGQVADQVERIHADGLLPLVLGGDCTISLGVVAGTARSQDVGLMYVDGDADLSTPDRNDSGVLDTMGVSHLLGEGTAELSRLGPRFPLLRPHQLELFGFDPEEVSAPQWAWLAGQELRATPVAAVQQDPVGRARSALARLSSGVDSILVHLDVDVLDTGAFPLANFPHFNGLSISELERCLAVFGAAEGLTGLVVTEVNPDHDPDGELLPVLVEMIARALASDPS